MPSVKSIKSTHAYLNVLVDFLPPSVWLVLFATLLAEAPWSPGSFIILPGQLALLGVITWWLTAPWIGWVPLLAWIGVQTLVLIGSDSSLDTWFTWLFTPIGLLVTKGYLNVLRPHYLQFLSKHWLFDASLTQRYPWLSANHPLRCVFYPLRRVRIPWAQRQWSHLGHMATRPEASPILRFFQPLRMYWVLFLTYPFRFFYDICALWFLIALGFNDFSNPWHDFRDCMASQQFSGLVFFGMILGFLLFMWIGWVPTVTLLLLGIIFPLAAPPDSPFSLFMVEDAPLGPLWNALTVTSVVILAQKGYLSFWRDTWLEELRTYAFFDFRPTTWNHLITRFHPVTLLYRLVTKRHNQQGRKGAHAE